MRLRSGWAVVGALGACAPALPDDGNIVVERRILVVKGDPPESKPGVAVTYTALVAAPVDASAGVNPTWDFCTAPKPPTEDNVVSSACLDDAALVPAGEGPSTTAATPTNACSLFGPDTPPGGFRPRDPDVTGGYYQPLRASLDGAEPSFALERLRCDLGMAPADIASAFASAYVPNENPELLPLSAAIAGTEAPLDAIPPSAVVGLTASWPPEDAETYAYFDRGSQSVTTRREAMRVTWYATAGHFEATSTGRDETDPASSTTNTWTAPATVGPNAIWVVLQDSRGGVDFARYDVLVTP